MFARRKNRDDILEKLNTVILPRLAELDLGLLLDEQKKGMTEDFLVWLRKERPCAVCQETLFTLYPAFRQHVVKDQIMDLVPVRPEMEFPEVREMHRHFILHIGPTNSGKTFRSLERLKLAGQRRLSGTFASAARWKCLSRCRNTMSPVPCGPVRSASKKMGAG